MQFEPLGGFPPLIRIDDIKITDDTKKNVSTRGFSSANIINIRNILNQQKKSYTEGASEYGRPNSQHSSAVTSKQTTFSDPIEYLEMSK